MIRFEDFTFTSSSGNLYIHVRGCIPDGEIKASVQIAHGIAEYAARYDEFASFLAENGIAVYANDHIGHGESVSDEWPLSYFGEKDGWKFTVGDMKKLHGIVCERHSGVPHYLFGHSMGSFLARTYAIDYPDDFDGLILSGTGQQPKALVVGGKTMAKMEIKRHGSKYQSPLLNILAFGSYNKGFENTRSCFDWLSRDNDCVDKYIEDPLCGFLPSAGLFYEMMCGIDYIGRMENIKKMNKEVPVYFMSGDADPVGENGKGVKRAYKCFVLSGIKDVSIRLYKEGRHEMLNEINKQEVYADILKVIEEWLENLCSE